MSSIHLELLDKKRRSVFEKLKIFEKEGVLAGGTALSLQIAHRHSFDFDVFFEREIKKADLLKLKKIFEIKSIDVNTRDQLTIATKQEIKMSLIYFYFNPLFEKIKTPSLPLFSVSEIASDKAYALGRRAVWRDYVDLFFILKWQQLDIFELIELATKKFGIEFNPKLFLEQLTYFDDLQPMEISFIKERYSEKEIQQFLIGQAKKFKEKII